MNKTYTFKQVIFGLRKEYLAVEKQLENLKKYVNKSNKVEYFYFHTAGNPCSIFLYLETKKSLVKEHKLKRKEVELLETTTQQIKEIKNKNITLPVITLSIKSSFPAIPSVKARYNIIKKLRYIVYLFKHNIPTNTNSNAAFIILFIRIESIETFAPNT